MSSLDLPSDASPSPSSLQRVCPYRTPRFHDHECENYLDCPTHSIARVYHELPSDGDPSPEGFEYEGASREEDAQDDEENIFADLYGNSEEEDMASGGQQAQSPEVIDLTSSPPAEQQHSSSPDVVDLTGDSHEEPQGLPPPPRPRQQQQQQQQQPYPPFSFTAGAIGPQGRMGPQLSRPFPTPATPGVGGAAAAPTAIAGASAPSLPSLRDGAVSPSAQRRPATPPSPPPPTRRRTSSNQFGAAPPPSRHLQQQQQQQHLLQPHRPSVSRRPSDIVLPRWQPDVEVTFCPICRTQFSFLVRKHHCRKCGRVVCSSCSPHRITIPYQYIVVPPGAPRPGLQRYPSSLISGEGGYADFSSLGGGERVRLCNPCVPDPNTNPPQSQQSPGMGRTHGRSQSTVDVSASAYGPTADTAINAYVRNRSATMVSPVMPPTYSPYASISGGPHHPQRAHRLRSSLRASGQESGSPSSSTAAAAAAAAQRRPLPPDPPQLAEEDECPVCHRELPPRNLSNFEALREAHISVCITSHSTYGGTPGAEGSSSQPRRTGMFPYLATEKDCVDSAECTICLEEFEVGVAMARLECLCRFHRDCIARWFAKNPGRCPVHSHDGHGF
ncbi:FYVE-domain-containing protein [Cryphonectria parasitica EP155]|uniref:RING-type E3 ubiquitin transferase n=1 Tax=Cryphonectria parasitica (strain ATCC 38755 / EP155) TaxID=660469 RepID=A0A9P5CLT5_CRYP1|nr:FYVE-domain-containing protein [Cryphonectria parasitica EP155]KAF3762366.1 FYVE-domain-containing protein [Cryphonectria parasitica EP155]